MCQHSNAFGLVRLAVNDGNQAKDRVNVDL